MAVLQILVGLMMILVKLGLFTSYSHSQRKTITSFIESRHKKIGVFHETKKRKVYLKQYDSPVGIEKMNLTKPWFPSLFITVIGSLEMIIVLIVIMI
ncbi:DUF3899 domain-containing protein [Candidatus Mycoplasma mahonii]|uniref:DUF3899 domain-containing protein n=1 Tax=Candidatus Mycoplasma mahonii TaxID=3004105 RepID=UPI0026F3531F|nr:DUF3899 domain-containing protein [Candidatus Mycoplasma mahonii]WKX02336.1 DUF3899 domain-containing protein [Candidatus Mycoplasma mahonii]